jgi:quercetin dioxygenase-like cupin family protein
MKIHKITEFFRGWFIGNFNPSVLNTKDFEVGLLTHKQGEHWPKHYHAIATEYNLLVSGKMIIKQTTIEPGDIFIIDPYEVADPIFLEDCTVLCIKTPSVPGDKYESI